MEGHLRPRDCIRNRSRTACQSEGGASLYKAPCDFEYLSACLQPPKTPINMKYTIFTTIVSLLFLALGAHAQQVTDTSTLVTTDTTLPGTDTSSLGPEPCVISPLQRSSYTKSLSPFPALVQMRQTLLEELNPSVGHRPSRASHPL